MTNRALNCVNKKGDLIRLVSFSTTKREDIEKQLKTAFDICIHLEKSYSDLCKENPNLPNESQFKWAHSLLYRPLTFYEWTNSFDYQIKPRFEHCISLMEGIDNLIIFKQHYNSSILRLFDKYQSFLEFNLSQILFPYSSSIFSHYPQLYQQDSSDSQETQEQSNEQKESPQESNELLQTEREMNNEESNESDSSHQNDTFEIEILQNKVVDLLLQADMSTILVGMRSPLYVVNIMRNLNVDFIYFF